MLITLCRLLGRLVRGGPTRPCVSPDENKGVAFMADARAEADFAVLGGWGCAGAFSPASARCFWVRMAKADLPEFLMREG